MSPSPTLAQADYSYRAARAREAALAAGFADGIYYADNACGRADALYAQMSREECPADGPYLLTDGRMVVIVREGATVTRAIFETA